MTSRKRGLGKGLDVLLSTSHSARQREQSEHAASGQQDERSESSDKTLRTLPIEWLKPGRYQPRKDMSSELLEELAQSIQAQGVIQPIVVRPVGHEQFEIIAGERRWRGAQLAGLHDVPCLVKDVDDNAAIAMALIENIQREDLNAMEEAVALQRLLDEFSLTHQQVADAVGKSRTAISNLLRLNGLVAEVKQLLEHGDIEMGHARALLSLHGDQQVEAGRIIAAKGLTVRETEKLVKKLLNPSSPSVSTSLDPDVERLQQRLSEQLGSVVKIQQSKQGKGKLVINYTSLAELDQIINKFN
ncbi:ParB/RepB/Spo0J family partition protein [Celerinatantimonas diazotrophica]|uniref:Probable chromosome-partitioning protein ParB n=1 Tax=Celerinatantimonas diazotrophica TaxID=412034 RepID=A0A4R1JA92_9GAMM|nr:ParB/RepB/Spo0J family partition protein [Celerinatantimonas diazotrophica]TCK47394.1 ParB family chromosome partitioning protein [Celerinatantimonas diazotrophica]CAG9294988.1 putative chromosome-partitioning protein ParB [Celerinatantimonas diazotrophica]